MPRLSLFRPNRTRDYQFLDRTISEMYTVGGLDIYVHKYKGPQAGGNDSALSGNFDATQPTYETVDVLNIQDLLLLENRDRVYDPDVYVMRGFDPVWPVPKQRYHIHDVSLQRHD